MLVNVTEEDIVRGKRGDCSLCPIALAVGRLFPKATYISVQSNKIAVDDTEFFVPNSAIAFIGRFDHGSSVYPFSFPLVARENRNY